MNGRGGVGGKFTSLPCSCYGQVLRYRGPCGTQDLKALGRRRLPPCIDKRPCATMEDILYWLGMGSIPVLLRREICRWLGRESGNKSRGLRKRHESHIFEFLSFIIWLLTPQEARSSVSFHFI